VRNLMVNCDTSTPRAQRPTCKYQQGDTRRVQLRRCIGGEMSQLRNPCLLALMMFCTALFSTALFSTSIHAAEPIEHTKVPLETVKKEVQEKKAVLVDVREKREWDRGHIEGAVFLPLSDLQQGIAPEKLARLLPKDKIIYAHCARGGRCVIAASLLQKNGYQIRPLKPGYNQLLKAGFEKAKQ
jgi:phage shock protein E